MKTAMFCLVAILAMSCSTSNMQEKSIDTKEAKPGTPDIAGHNGSLSIGLVAWYPLNGNANDASGHGFNGVVHGATLAADRFGNPNSAYSFNGWNNYISCGDILNDVFSAPVATFSVSGWANTRSPGSQASGGGCIVTKSGGGDAGPYQWSITHYVGDLVNGAVFSEPTGTRQILEKSNGPAPLNQWFHFVFVFNGTLPENDRVQIYVNGSRTNERTFLQRGAISTTTTQTPAPLCFGSSMNLPVQPGNFYNGTIDDVRIYDRALNSEEIRASYVKDGYMPAPRFVVQPASLIPPRNSLQGLPKSSMSVLFSKDFDVSTLSNTTVCVNGSISGRHECTFSKSGESGSAIIAAKTAFRTGEVVTVTLTRGIMSTAGESLSNSFSWSFTERTNGGSGLFQVDRSISLGNGSNPHSGAVLDVDRNGTLDMVFANYDLGTLSILRNDNSGTLVRTSTVNVGDHPNSVVTADFDGDGIPDLVSTNFGSNTISVLKNDGTGTFTSTTVGVGSHPISVAAADLNGDGSIDLAVVNNYSNSVSIMANDGQGNFATSATVQVGAFPTSVTAADLNNDGFIDLAVTNSQSNSVTILLNKGNGTFNTGRSAPVGSMPWCIAAADLNGDGNLDLAVTNNASGTISILLNNGTGNFNAGLALTPGGTPSAVTAIDVNGDGYIDLAVDDNTRNTLSIWMNTGSAFFSTGSVVSVGSYPCSVVAADFNRDGKIELATANGIGNSISLLSSSGQWVPVQNPAKGPKDPGTLEVLTEFTSPAGYQMLFAGDRASLKLLVRNNGQQVFKNVQVRLDVIPNTAEITIDRVIFLGNIAPNAEVTTGCSVTASENVGTRSLRVFIQIVADNGIAVRPKELSITTKARGAGDNVAREVPPTTSGWPVRDTTRGMRYATHADVIKTTTPGRNYALLFAGNNYEYWPHLTNPVPDAQAMEQELKKSYGFNTDLVLDATRDGMLTALRRYARMRFGETDQLIIFFAGHGQFDPVLGDGYLVAKDSRLSDDVKTSYVSHSVLRTIVNNIPCKHIFLVVDACFGGTFDPLIAANSRGDDLYGELTKTEFIQRKMQFKTRRFLTSGGKEYVPDGRPGQHSPFVRKFLEALRSYGGSDGVLTINEILQYEEKVTPQPRAGEFGTNEPGSDFIFIAH